MKQKIINISIITFITALLVLIIVCNATKASDSNRVGELAREINELQNLKEQCYDNLSYQDSIKQYEWKEKFCYEWDEQIMSMREELDKLTTHSYMGLIKE